MQILLVDYTQNFLDNNVVMAEEVNEQEEIRVRPTDFLTVTYNGFFSSYDKDSLVDLYGPIIGYEAVSLYLFLMSEAKLEQIGHGVTHEQFIGRIGMNIDIFNMARRQLEAMGLIKTYRKKTNDVSLYQYVLYEPYSPYKFFNSPVYYPLLKKAVGEEQALKIASLYTVDEAEPEGDDVSASYKEVYNPAYDSKEFIPETRKSNLRRNNPAEINSKFSMSDFFVALDSFSNPNPILKDAFSDNELKEIERFAALYGVSEYDMARVVYINFKAGEPYGERIKSKDLKRQLDYQSQFKVSNSLFTKNLDPSLISSRSDLAKKINEMEISAPIQYLRDIQGGADVAPADSKILDNLSANYKLTNPVLNALVTYTLETQHNTLPSNYMEKVAAALAREGVKTAADALNYLYGTRKKNTKKTTDNNKNNTNSGTMKNEDEDDNISQEEWDELINRVTNGGK